MSHWNNKRLEEVCTIIAGQSPDSKYYNQDGAGIPFFQGKADFGSLYPTIRIYCSQPHKIAEKGDILLSVRAPVGPTNLAPCRVCIGRGLTAIRPNEELLTKFVLLFFRYYEAQLEQQGGGTTFKAITQATVKSIKIPVPSLDEQERIVAKTEELFSDLDNGVATLKRAKTQVAFYRQAAISSTFPKLTANTQVKLDEIAEISSGITKGRKLPGDGVISLPYLRVANVQNGYLNLDDVKEIELKAEEKERFLLHIDDILYTEGGDRDKLGRGTIWRGEIPQCVHQNHIFKARPNKQKVLPQYLAYWSMSTDARNYFYAKGKQSVNLASINKTVLSNLPVPLPTIDVQKLIVQDIESISTSCAAIERTISKALQQASSLRQSILKKAFEGELI